MMSEDVINLKAGSAPVDVAPALFGGSRSDRTEPLVELDLPGQQSRLSSESSERVEVESAPDLPWRSCLASQGVVAAIVTISISGPPAHNQAYLIGFDEARGDPGLTRRLLGFAETVWSKASPPGHVTFHVADVAAAVGNRISIEPLDRLCREFMPERFGPALAVQARVRGAVLRGVFFKAVDGTPVSAGQRAEIDKLLPLFAEHANVKASLARQSQQTAMLEAMFDRVSLPVMLLDEHCRPLFTNAAAEGVLGERRWLLRNPDSMIASPNSTANRELRAAVHRAANSTSRTGGEQVVRIDGQGGDWRLVQVVPPSFRQCGEGPRSAMVIVLSPSKVDASPTMLQALGLLPSEQKFLGHFLQSNNIGEAAVDCGISEETARTYLKRVRAKLGVNRQMELASLISRLALPLREGELVAQG